MSYFACVDIVETLTTLFQRRDVQEAVLDARRSGGSESAYAAVLTSVLPEDIVPLALVEFGELPRCTLPLIVEAWYEAHGAGKPFSVRSERPSRPVDTARRLAVTIAVEADSKGVSVVLRHVAGRHAAWYGAGRQTAIAS